MSRFHVGQKVVHHFQRWAPDGWQQAEEVATVINPNVTEDPYQGDVEISVDGVLNRIFTSPDGLRPFADDIKPLPFIHDDRVSVLVALNDMNATEFAYNFCKIAEKTELTTDRVAIACRQLRESGHVLFVRGLQDDDGILGGSGYMLSGDGHRYIVGADA